jgi:hypothetical protein
MRYFLCDTVAITESCGSAILGRSSRVKATRRFSSIAVFSSASNPAFTNFPQGSKQFDECGELIVRVQAAWIGQDPHLGPFEALRLAANGGFPYAESMAIRTHAEERDDARPIPPDLGGEPPAAADEFMRLELLGRRSGAVHEIADAVARREELALLGGMQLPARKAGSVQDRPEAVAGAREVVAGGGRIEAGIDAHEQDAQAGRDHVPQALVF